MTEIRLNNKICIFDTSATVSQILAELNLRYSYIVLQQAANKYYVCRPAQLLFWIKFPESFPNTSEDTGNIPLKGLEHLLNELKASGLNSPLGQMFPFNETQRCYPDKHGFASDVGRNKTTQCRTGFAIPFVTFAELQSGLKRLGLGCKPRHAQEVPL